MTGGHARTYNLNAHVEKINLGWGGRLKFVRGLFILFISGLNRWCEG